MTDGAIGSLFAIGNLLAGCRAALRAIAQMAQSLCSKVLSHRVKRAEAREQSARREIDIHDRGSRSDLRRQLCHGL